MLSRENFDTADESGISPVSLSEALKITLKNIRFVLLFAFAVAVCAAAISLLIPNQYTATTTILPPSGDSRPGGLASMLESSPALEMISFGQEKNSPSMLYPDILKSRLLTEEILKNNYIYNSEGESLTTDLYEYLDEDNPDRAHKALLSHTEIDYNKKSGIVTVSITTGIPELSAEVANFYIDKLDEFNRYRRKSSAMLKREFVEQRLAENKTELAEAEEALKTFRQNNRNYLTMTDPQLIMEHDRLLREVAVKTQIYQMLSEEFEISAIQEKKETPVIQVLDRANIPSVKSSPARARITVLAFIFGFFAAAGLTVAGHVYSPGENRYDLANVLKRIRLIRTPEEQAVEIER